jgi:hypothetical protein
LTRGVHENPYLQNAWNLHGGASFVFEVVALAPVDAMLEVEQRHIDECGLYPRGYNVNPVAAKPPASYRPTTYRGFISPSGEPVTITDLKAFCGARGLDTARMFDVRTGRTRHHHGWTYRDSGYAKRMWSDGHRYDGFVSPQGVQVSIINLTAFCKELGLDAPCMLRLMRGQSLQHKGWTHTASRRPTRYGNRRAARSA